MMTEGVVKTKKLSLFSKVGYGFGTAPDSIPYTLFLTYFVFYLTDVAGVSAGVAGTIAAMATFINAIIAPFIGFISDNSRNPKGRRIPMMGKALIASAIIMLALFVPVDFGGAKVAYYLVVSVLFWVIYTAWCVPYYALGAEMTDDYDDRNTLITIKGVFAYPVCMIAQSGSIAVVGICAAKGMSMQNAWFIASIVMMACIVILAAVTLITCKGKELAPKLDDDAPKAKFNPKEFLVDYKDLFMVKACRKVYIYNIIFCIGYGIAQTTVVYALVYNAGMSEAQQASFWGINTILCVIGLPIVLAVANKWDKKYACILFLILSSVWNIAFAFIGLDSYIKMVIFSGSIAFSCSAFFGIYYSMLYDTIEVADLKLGERKEGSITSLSILCQTLGTAIGTTAAGWLLQAIGYTGAGEESASTITGLLYVVTIAPSVFILGGLVFIFTHNITRERHEEIKKLIAARDAGEVVDIEPFRDLMGR